MTAITPTIVIFGSALRTPETARDLDVAYAGCDAATAADAARAWAAEAGLPDLPVDAHEMPLGFQGPRLRVVVRYEPVLVICGGPVERYVPRRSLSTAIRRAAALGGRLERDTRAYRIAIGEPDPDAYGGDGIEGTRRALERCSDQQIARLLSGLPYLVEILGGATLSPEARLGCAGGASGQPYVEYAPTEAGGWRLQTTHGGKCAVVDGVIVPV